MGLWEMCENSYFVGCTRSPRSPGPDLTFLICLLWVKITLHMLNKHTKEISKPINKIILNMRNYQYQCDD